MFHKITALYFERNLYVYTYAHIKKIFIKVFTTYTQAHYTLVFVKQIQSITHNFHVTNVATTKLEKLHLDR